MKKLIIFLVRKKLHLRKFQRFKFENQKQKGEYYFDSVQLVKVIKGQREISGVSLNWILDDDCKIELI